MLGELFRANWPCAGLGYSAAHFRLAAMGFCSIRSWLAVYLRRVAALMMQFPPFGGGEAVVQGGVAPESQTTSVKNAGEGCGGRGGLRFGGIDRCRGVLFARHPPNMPLSLLLRTAQHVEASIA